MRNRDLQSKKQNLASWLLRHWKIIALIYDYVQQVLICNSSSSLIFTHKPIQIQETIFLDLLFFNFFHNFIIIIGYAYTNAQQVVLELEGGNIWSKFYGVLGCVFLVIDWGG